MNNRQLYCFILSAENLSFRKTADLLYITEPGVSHLIKTLETELGFRLFDRKNQRIFLSEAGEYFYHEIKPIYEQLKNITERTRIIAQHQEEKQLIYYCHFCDDVMPILLQHHEEMAPKSYSIALLTNMLIAPADVLKSGAADLAFCTETDVLDDDAFCFIPFHERYDYCLVQKDHPLARHQEITFKDLRNQVILNAQIKKVFHDYDVLLDRIIAEVPSVELRFIDDEVYMNACLLSAKGICIIPMKQEEYDNTGYIKILPLIGGCHNTWGVAYLKEKESPELLDLAEEIKAIS